MISAAALQPITLLVILCKWYNLDQIKANSKSVIDWKLSWICTIVTGEADCVFALTLFYTHKNGSMGVGHVCLNLNFRQIFP